MKPYSKYCKLLALAAGVSLAVPASSRAAVVLTLQQVGSDVVLSMAAGGSINLDSTTYTRHPFPTTPFTSALRNSVLHNGVIVHLGSGSSFDLLSAFISGPSLFGTGPYPQLNATSSTGGPFGLITNNSGTVAISVPSGYVLGTALGAASSTFAGQSFASLGITPGTYVWTIGTNPTTDTITLNVRAPESASLLVPATAVATLGLVQVRRRSRRA